MSVVRTEVLVIGSGAGGGLTAATLAENGRTTTVIEEGPWIDPDMFEPFTIDEMKAKYRHRGLSATLGRPPIAYVEGRCVGGGTEINSGLFHRPPPEILADWRDRYRLRDCDPAALEAHVADIERALSVGPVPAAPPTSAVLERGASALGWHAVEVPRVFRYSGSRGQKQTMTRTFIPRAVSAGATVMPRCRAVRLIRRGRRAEGAICRVERDGRTETISVLADHVFVCAGAIETPALLHRSGIVRNIGRGLKTHPTIKLGARFAEPLEGHEDVPMHQVKEFAPEITLGGAASRKGYVALALADDWESGRARLADWRNIAVYYASIRSDGSGSVAGLPGLRGAVVTYRLTEADLSRLARGLVHLTELLFAAGAEELYPSIAGVPPLTDPSEAAGLWERVVRSRAGLMTIHLFSTVRMGDDRSKTGADSYGRVWGFDNLRVNDASLIPDAPGVNPQGTIMAVASRNCAYFLDAA